MDRLVKAVLESIAKTGRCYTNEAKAMAEELLERREKDTPSPDSSQSFIPYPFYP